MATDFGTETLAALPFPKWVPLLRETLAREGRLRWRVEGRSMVPTLPPNCTIEIEGLGDSVTVGDLFVYANHGALVVHRLVGRRGAQLVFQGDHRHRPDSVVGKEQLIGRVVGASYQDTLIYPPKFGRLVAVFWIVRYYGLKGVRFLRRNMPKRG